MMDSSNRYIRTHMAINMLSQEQHLRSLCRRRKWARTRSICRWLSHLQPKNIWVIQKLQSMFKDKSLGDRTFRYKGLIHQERERKLACEKCHPLEQLGWTMFVAGSLMYLAGYALGRDNKDGKR